MPSQITPQPNKARLLTIDVNEPGMIVNIRAICVTRKRMWWNCFLSASLKSWEVQCPLSVPIIVWLMFGSIAGIPSYHDTMKYTIWLPNDDAVSDLPWRKQDWGSDLRRLGNPKTTIPEVEIAVQTLVIWKCWYLEMWYGLVTEGGKLATLRLSNAQSISLMFWMVSNWSLWWPGLGRTWRKAVSFYEVVSSDLVGSRRY